MQEQALYIDLLPPPNFSLQKAVCSYGFFMTAPNLWINGSSEVASGTLQRPLRLLDGRSVLTRTTQQLHKIRISVFGVQQLADDDKEYIAAQVSRMLRLSESESAAIAAFHALHHQASEEGFGWLFRSPNLFEDMVKSLLLCNCGWGRTLAMATALCELQAELKGPPLGHTLSESITDKLLLSPKTPEVRDAKRKRRSREGQHFQSHRMLTFGNNIKEGVSLNLPEKQETTSEISDSDDGALSDGKLLMSNELNHSVLFSQAIGNFPSPEELCQVDVDILSRRCALGYRGHRIWKLAKDVCDGTLDLELLGSSSFDDARSILLQLNGFGPFTCANVLTCLGKYDTIPSDTETVRHLKQVHGRSNCSLSSISKDVAEVYDCYAPYQFLSYWFELWGSYEKKFGKFCSMNPCHYGLITGHNMRNKGFISLDS